MYQFPSPVVFSRQSFRSSSFSSRDAYDTGYVMPSPPSHLQAKVESVGRLLNAAKAKIVRRSTHPPAQPCASPPTIRSPYSTTEKSRATQPVSPPAPARPRKGTPLGDCAICLNSMVAAQALFITPCSHAFHYKCVQPLVSSPGFVCPMCRRCVGLEECHPDADEEDSDKQSGVERELNANVLP